MEIALDNGRDKSRDLIKYAAALIIKDQNMKCYTMIWYHWNIWNSPCMIFFVKVFVLKGLSSSLFKYKSAFVET